ncbi:hypothetical protein BsIDN1_02570 [Bacillus safensis]|uniref:DNA-directed RNA polymerase RpoA/D/Rpb3-type domain-containing protein n=1 Tax=Bacillus safensis TaxID=561879 RepID=A0A5S9M416_BACIA|nr:hypothetical protein BsIDN1_02570 [Bacillus safensis]
MIEIEKPKIETVEISDDAKYGKFVVEPLERGYGTTLGNSPSSYPFILTSWCSCNIDPDRWCLTRILNDRRRG